MVVGDPAADLLRLVTAAGDPPPSHASDGDRRAAELLRRRFGLSLPTPFVGPPSGDEPVRVAQAADGPAIAAVKWRAFGANYRGLLADDFLDGRDVVPPPSFWIGRAMVPPSRRHRLLVWGRPGVVHGYLDAGPAHPDDLDLAALRPGLGADDVGEVHELYVDPSAQGRGGGRRLLAEAIAWFEAAGFGTAELSVLARNADARAFYGSQGWEPSGRTIAVDLGVVAFEEARYARPIGGARP